MHKLNSYGKEDEWDQRKNFPNRIKQEENFQPEILKKETALSNTSE